MGWFSWGRKTEEGDYAKVLENLQTSIDLKEQKLADIRARERRAVVRFTIYSSSIWALWTLAWWLGFIGRRVLGGGSDGAGEGSDEITAWEKIVGAAPVIGGPILIVYTRRIFGWWYKRKRDIEEKVLKDLRKRSNDTLAELRKKTRYDETQKLLERYDNGVKRKQKQSDRPSSASGTPARAGQSPPGVPQIQVPFPATPGNQVRGHNSRLSMPANFGPGASPGFGMAPMPPPSQPRGWLDKVADALIGESENSPDSKYALICQNCFTHNGLVLREELNDTQYRCIKCGHLNLSRRARGLAGEAETPRQRHVSMGATPSPRPTSDEFLSPEAGGPGNDKSRPHSFHGAGPPAGRGGQVGLGIGKGGEDPRKNFIRKASNESSSRGSSSLRNESHLEGDEEEEEEEEEEDGKDGREEDEDEGNSRGEDGENSAEWEGDESGDLSTDSILDRGKATGVRRGDMLDVQRRKGARKSDAMELDD